MSVLEVSATKPSATHPPAQRVWSDIRAVAELLRPRPVQVVLASAYEFFKYTCVVFFIKNPIIWDLTAAMLSTVVMQKQQLNWKPKATEPGKGVSQEVT